MTHRRDFLKRALGIGAALSTVGASAIARAAGFPALPAPSSADPENQYKIAIACISNPKLRRMVIKFTAKADGTTVTRAHVDKFWASLHANALAHPQYTTEVRTKCWPNETRNTSWMTRQYREDLAHYNV